MANKKRKTKKETSSKELDRRLIQKMVSEGIPLDPDTKLPIIGFKEPPLVADEIDESLNGQSILDLEI